MVLGFDHLRRGRELRIKVPTPARRIEPFSLRTLVSPSKDKFDSTRDSRRRLRLRTPDWLEHVEELRHTDVPGVQLADLRKCVELERVLPLPRVLCVPPARFMRSDVSLRDRGNVICFCWGCVQRAFRRTPLGNRVPPLQDSPTLLARSLERLSQGDRRVSAEPKVATLLPYNDPQCPHLHHRRRWQNSQIKTRGPSPCTSPGVSRRLTSRAVRGLATLGTPCPS